MKRKLYYILSVIFSLLLIIGCSAKQSSISMEETKAYGNFEVAEDSVNKSEEPVSENAKMTKESEISITQDRKLIKEVSLEIETYDLNSYIQVIKDTTNSFGGYIENLELRSDSWSGTEEENHKKGENRFSHITARIPANSLDSFLNQAQENVNVTYRNDSISDVTLQYSDTESHIKSLEIEKERLDALLEKADSIETIIALESRLSEVRYELENYHSSLNILNNQIDYATVNLNINKVNSYTTSNEDNFFTRVSTGFMRNLKSVGISFVNLAVIFLSSIPTLLVCLVIIIIIVFIFKKLKPKFFKKKQNADTTNTNVNLDQLNETNTDNLDKK